MSIDKGEKLWYNVLMDKLRCRLLLWDKDGRVEHDYSEQCCERGFNPNGSVNPRCRENMEKLIKEHNEKLGYRLDCGHYVK